MLTCMTESRSGALCGEPRQALSNGKPGTTNCRAWNRLRLTVCHEQRRAGTNSTTLPLTSSQLQGITWALTRDMPKRKRRSGWTAA